MKVCHPVEMQRRVVKKRSIRRAAAVDMKSRRRVLVAAKRKR